MGKKNGNGNHWTVHHILPTSRGGNNGRENKIFVKEKEHEAYHLIFSNMTPEEVLITLFEKWGFGIYFYNSNGSLSRVVSRIKEITKNESPSRRRKRKASYKNKTQKLVRSLNFTIR
jgi:hypothetical protein